jgi:hypothetical protein
MLVWIGIVASFAILIGALILRVRHVTRDADTQY